MKNHLLKSLYALCLFIFTMGFTVWPVHADAQWTSVAGEAFEIAAGGTGTVWSIRQVRPGTSTYIRGVVQRYNGTAWETIPTSLGGSALDVAPDNHAYLVDDTGAVYKYDGAGWHGFGNKKARDI
ncbi:MAG TPA: hypothetical protein PKD90_17900 [Phnomibacter sp.]|nr:hypothetical protein [Phnomibacter sp.]